MREITVQADLDAENPYEHTRHRIARSMLTKDTASAPTWRTRIRTLDLDAFSFLNPGPTPREYPALVTA
jgi:hypothetical protein